MRKPTEQRKKLWLFLGHIGDYTAPSCGKYTARHDKDPWDQGSFLLLMLRYRLQTMAIHQVAEDTSTIRSLDWDRDRFDIEFRLERGTTYNSYIIKGDKVRVFQQQKITARVWEIHGKHNMLALHTLNVSYIWGEVSYPLTWFVIMGKLMFQTSRGNGGGKNSQVVQVVGPRSLFDAVE